jgi:hypothetical protein
MNRKITFDEIKPGDVYNYEKGYYCFYKKTANEAFYIYFYNTSFILDKMVLKNYIGQASIVEDKRIVFPMLFTFRHKEF